MSDINEPISTKINEILTLLNSLDVNLRLTILINLADSLPNNYKAKLCSILCVEDFVNTVYNKVVERIKQSRKVDVEDLTLDDVTNCIELIDYVKNQIVVKLTSKGMGSTDMLPQGLIHEILKSMKIGEESKIRDKYKEIEDTIRKLREKKSV